MTAMLRTLAALALLLSFLGAPIAAAQPPSEQQEEFVPIDELPPEDRLPAAPLLIGAYAFVVVVLFVYLVSVSRRLTAVQREVDRLEAAVKRSGRP